jgi:Family of unknown function (DUF6101)
MASVTPAAGGIGYGPDLSGCPTHTTTVETDATGAAERPRVERIGSVRILRAGPGWRGVALRLAISSGADDKERFELALNEGDGRSITIACIDQDDAVALWRDCGRASGLPLLLETPDGAVTEPYPQIGRVALGPIRIRRRHAFLNGRRPRFLVRRKTGRLADRPVFVQGERLTD